MLDPTLLAAGSATLEALINRALAYDPATRNALQVHTGKSLAIDIRELDLTLCFHLGDPIRVTHDGDGASVRLRGRLPALVALALSDSTHLGASDVEVWGSTALLADIQTLARQLDIDWEEALNNWLGDVAGHSLAAGLRRQFDWANQRRRSLERLLQEFLTEELRATPAAPELHHFYNEVDDLQLRVDRLQARLDRLRQRRSANP